MRHTGLTRPARTMLRRPGAMSPSDSRAGGAPLAGEVRVVLLEDPAVAVWVVEGLPASPGCLLDRLLVEADAACRQIRQGLVQVIAGKHRAPERAGGHGVEPGH